MADQQIEELQDLNTESNPELNKEGGGTPPLEGEALEKVLAGHGESSTSLSDAEQKVYNTTRAQQRMAEREERKLKAEQEQLKQNEYALLKQQNEELQAQLKQAANPNALLPPTMEEANQDPAVFAQMQNEWIQNQQAASQELLTNTIRQVAEDSFNQMNNQRTQTERDSEVRETTSQHYERANKLKVSDYEKTEDAAIAALGSNFVDGVISAVDNSELVLYRLGKNPALMQEIANLQVTNPSKAAIKIGQISKEQELTGKRNRPPEPEVQIEGKGAGESQDDSLEAIRERALKGTSWA